MKFKSEHFSYTVYLGCISICCVNKFSGINAEPHNIALGKQTHQGPADYCNINGCCTSDLAVDGYLGQNPRVRDCSHTTSNGAIQGSWWSVDFKGDYFLALIRVLRRFDADDYGSCCIGRMNGISIKGKPGNKTIFSDGNPFFVYRKKDISITVPESLSDFKFSGISISVPGSLLTLCEVQVYEGKSCDNKLPFVSNGNWISADANDNCYYYGCDYTFNCTTGYTLTGSYSITTTCNTNGVWTTPVGSCEARLCSNHLPYRSNGNWISANANGNCHYYGCAYTLNCASGYTIRGSRITTCNAYGVWTTSVGTCEARSCSNNLPYKSNGNWISANANGYCYYYGCVYTLKCAKGYTIRGSNSITTACNANGVWTAAVGTCEVRSCNTLPYRTNGNWISAERNGNCYYYQCAYIFSCARGYTVNGSNNITTTCGASGLWTTPVGTCEAIECPVLNGIGANYVVRSSPNGTKYNTPLTADCLEGYVLSSGNLNRTCLANGTWSGIEPNCTIIKCTVPPNRGMNNLIKNDTVDFIYRDVLAYKCNDGFELSSGNLTRHCQSSGDWSGKEPNCTEIRNPEESSSDNAAVVGSSVAGVLAAIVVVAIVVILLFRRSKRQKLNGEISNQGNKTYHLHAVKLDSIEERVYSNINTSYENDLKLDTGGSNEYICDDDRKTSLPDTGDKEAPKVRSEEYYNISSFDKKLPTVIMLENLTDFVLAGKTAQDSLESEFKKFPSGLVESHKTAIKPANRNKNRYRRIYAYDNTRVILTDCRDAADTDYINASYIQGFDTVRAYIASQGPTKDMINDFWRMVWQQNSSKIVMLTNLEEDSKMKCLQYWPDKDSHQYGSVTVRIRDTEIYSDFVIRTLGIKQGLSQERVVYQFHFTAWPDKGVPKFSSAIVNFRNKVRNTRIREAGPTIVHCSAGIGRTGTYIALDILTEQGEHLGYVDVAACVKDLRRQRVNMVQTLDQYVFLHSALTEALMLSSSAISAAKFPELYRELLHVDPVKRKRNIEATFDMLKNMSPVADENQYSCAREVKNRKRNRYSNILPVSEFMPPLLASSKDGYINAVYLPSYKERKALILTQMPLKDTKSELWALVQAQHVRTIVMMNTIVEVEREEIYWPDLGETMSFNNTDIETVEVETVGQHKVINMKMNDKYLEFDRAVKLIQCGYWSPSQRLPDSPSDILETLELVQTLQQQSGNHPIVVHCMNGVDRSGLFCVMYAVIERLKIEQDVAITQVIEQMRCCRDQIIPSLEQFQFCHEVVLTYIQQFSEYSNFSVQ